MLQDGKNAALQAFSGNAAGICFADVSTGTAHITELKRRKIVSAVIAELCATAQRSADEPRNLDCREPTGSPKKI